MIRRNIGNRPAPFHRLGMLPGAGAIGRSVKYQAVKVGNLVFEASVSGIEGRRMRRRNCPGYWR